MAAAARLRLVASALLGAALATSACSPPLDWRESRVDADGSGLVALFPCRPAYNMRSVDLAGRQVEWSLHACEAAGRTFALSHARLQDAKAVDEALLQLTEAARRNVGSGAAPAVSAYRVPGASMTAASGSGRLELDGTLPSGASAHVSTLLFVRGMQVFQATMIAPAGDAEAADTFFNGLKFPG